mmetsp:Transcript_9910/g.19455  ORF Transcript_9910/g.19455 Transcript_9910/m.19455 type:complete len:231 (+) Transcript_9910:652-1344(+)
MPKRNNADDEHQLNIMTRGTLAIDIVSDVLCPWCWIGKRNLDAAIQQTGRAVNISWKPFLLRPNVPEEGLAKPVPTANNPRVSERLLEAGRSAGIEFTDKCDLVPNTVKAHALLQYAEFYGQQGTQHALAEILFRKYFIDGQFVGNDEVLREAAVEAGLEDPDKALLYAHKPEVQQEIKEDAVANARRGITSVPTFFVNGRPIFSGAQPVSKFLELLTDETKLLGLFRVD